MSGVAIPCGYVSCDDKGGVAVILLMNRDTMITIPDIKDYLLCVGRYRAGLVEGRNGYGGSP